MNFFNKVKNSIYSPQFYSEVPKKSFSSALVYFLLLAFLVTVIRSIVPIWDFATVGQKEINKFVSSAVDKYPSGLMVKIKDGKVTTNEKEPYIIPMPDGNQGEGMQNLIVIDTKTPFSTTQFNKYQTLAWVTRDSVFVKDNDQVQFRTIDLSKTKDFTLNKAFINSIVVKVSPWLKLITPVAIVAIIVFMFLSNIFMLVYLFFVAVLIWLLLKLIKTPYSYWESYKVGMYALTLGFFVDIFFEIIHSPGVPLMHTVLTLLVVLFNFLPAKKAVRSKK